MQSYLKSTFQAPLPFVRIALTLLICHNRKGKSCKRKLRLTQVIITTYGSAFQTEPVHVSDWKEGERGAALTSTSPVKSLYLSRMTGSAGFSLKVLERSRNCCSGAEGVEQISLSPRLWLRLWDPANTHTRCFNYRFPLHFIYYLALCVYPVL